MALDSKEKLENGVNPSFYWLYFYLVESLAKILSMPSGETSLVTDHSILRQNIPGYMVTVIHFLFLVANIYKSSDEGYDGSTATVVFAIVFGGF